MQQLGLAGSRRLDGSIPVQRRIRGFESLARFTNRNAFENRGRTADTDTLLEEHPER